MRCLLLLAVAVFAFSPAELEREFVAQEPPAYTGDPTSEARLPLSQLEDNYLFTRLAFTAGGKSVHVSGGRAEGKYFVALTPDGGGTVFVDGASILFSSKRVTLEGETFEVDVDISILKQRNSKLRVHKVEGKKKTLLIQPTINQLVDAGYAAGTDLTLGGKAFKFVHGRKVVKTETNFAFGAGKFIGFLHKDGDKISDFGMDLAALARGPQKLNVGAAVLTLKLEKDVLVVDD